MREIALFVEDRAHREVIGALVQRLAAERDLEVRLHWHSVAGGHGRVAQEFRSFLTDLERAAGGDPETRRPDLIVVATDANCHGFAERAKEILPVRSPAETVLAIPDPHIERWLLLDGAAVKTVLGRGCDAPDQKCIRHRYKQMLSQVVLAAGLQPHFDGVEFAADIVREMDLNRAAGSDRSLGRFLDALGDRFKTWR